MRVCAVSLPELRIELVRSQSGDTPHTPGDLLGLASLGTRR